MPHAPHSVRIFHRSPSRDRKDGRATWQPQGVGSEAYLNGTSQEPTPEDVQEDGHIQGRSQRFMKYQGYNNIAQIMQDYNGLVLEYWSIGVME